MVTKSINKPDNLIAPGHKIRIDKWLWAARFYKTRSLASEAIKKGKILIDGDKIKPSRELRCGETLTISQNFLTKTVLILGLSERRGPASVAQSLYQETTESIENRERLNLLKKAQPGLRDAGQGRPTKKERRQIIQFTEKST